MLHIIVQIAMYLLENIEVGVVKPIIELTKYMFSRILRKIKIIFLLVKKIFFLSFEYLFEKNQNKYNVIFGGKIFVFRKFVKTCTELDIYLVHQMSTTNPESMNPKHI